MSGLGGVAAPAVWELRPGAVPAGQEAGPGSSPLDSASKLSWAAVVYPECGEMVLYQPTNPRPHGDEPVEAEPFVLVPFEDCQPLGPGRAELEAVAGELTRKAKAKLSNTARARTKSRRYCKANRIDRLITLTFDPGRGVDRCDPDAVALAVRSLFIALRQAYGESFPYLWVRELHKDGRRYHVHIGLARPIAMRCKAAGCRGAGRPSLLSTARIPGPCLTCAWTHGIVDARRLTPRGRVRTRMEATRLTAGYLSKYVGKAFEEAPQAAVSHGNQHAGTETPQKSRHRYEVGQGFLPIAVQAEVPGPEATVVNTLARLYFDARPASFTWSSDDCEGWEAPAVRVLFYDG